MSLQRVATIAALAVALGATSAQAEWIEVERAFAYVTPAPGSPPGNRYYVGLAWHEGLQDVADSSFDDPCVGDAGGDGVLNADDMLCTFWTSRFGRMTIIDLNAGGGSCLQVGRTIMRMGSNARTIGTAFEYRRGAGYLVVVSKEPWMSDSLVENRVLLRGRCDLPTPRQPVETLPCDQLIAVAWDSSHRFQHDPVCGPQEDYQDDELGSPRNADACDDGLFRPWPGAGLEATVTGSPRGRSGYFGLSVHSQGEGKDARVLLVGAAERPRPGIVIKVLNEAHHGPTTYEPDPEGCPP